MYPDYQACPVKNFSKLCRPLRGLLNIFLQDLGLTPQALCWSPAPQVNDSPPLPCGQTLSAVDSEADHLLRKLVTHRRQRGAVKFGQHLIQNWRDAFQIIIVPVKQIQQPSLFLAFDLIQERAAKSTDHRRIELRSGVLAKVFKHVG
jgi:hypothetical protein